MSEPRIGILVVAYNAATTLASVLDRIPASVRPRIEEVIVADDASPDGGSTYLVGLGYQTRGSDLPLTVIRHEKNLGYGGNQKAGYRYAIDKGMDIIVMLHGDGQYAPEALPDILEPLVEGRADAVFGSRMMIPGAARRGGMPMYKYVGNKILSTAQNRLMGANLSEWHSGYRAYSVKALASVPFEANADGFNFDTQIILQLFDAGKRIVEVPIPTYYGDEICHVNGLKYAKDIMGDTARYRLQKMGFGSGTLAHAGDACGLKPTESSSHGRILRRMASEPPSKVLDLG
ncbi:MAG: glycosyltransferase family 2 protein, partial [Acidimicrobiia bacterium]